MKLILIGGRVASKQLDSQNTAMDKGGISVIVPDDTPVEIGQAWNVSLEEARAARLDAVRDVCQAVLDPVGREYGSWEVATFDQQYAEAKAFRDDPSSPVALIGPMAAARGITVAEQAGKIIANRATWCALTGNVIGQKQRIEKLIEAAAAKDGATVADVLAVDVTITLPS